MDMRIAASNITMLSAASPRPSCAKYRGREEAGPQLVATRPEIKLLSHSSILPRVAVTYGVSFFLFAFPAMGLAPDPAVRGDGTLMTPILNDTTNYLLSAPAAAGLAPAAAVNSSSSWDSHSGSSRRTRNVAASDLSDTTLSAAPHEVAAQKHIAHEAGAARPGAATTRPQGVDKARRDAGTARKMQDDGKADVAFVNKSQLVAGAAPPMTEERHYGGANAMMEVVRKEHDDVVIVDNNSDSSAAAAGRTMTRPPPRGTTSSTADARPVTTDEMMRYSSARHQVVSSDSSDAGASASGPWSDEDYEAVRPTAAKLFQRRGDVRHRRRKNRKQIFDSSQGPLQFASIFSTTPDPDRQRPKNRKTADHKTQVRGSMSSTSSSSFAPANTETRRSHLTVDVASQVLPPGLLNDDPEYELLLLTRLYRRRVLRDKHYLKLEVDVAPYHVQHREQDARNMMKGTTTAMNVSSSIFDLNPFAGASVFSSSGDVEQGSSFLQTATLGAAPDRAVDPAGGAPTRSRGDERSSTATPQSREEHQSAGDTMMVLASDLNPNADPLLAAQTRALKLQGLSASLHVQDDILSEWREWLDETESYDTFREEPDLFEYWRAAMEEQDREDEAKAEQMQSSATAGPDEDADEVLDHAAASDEDAEGDHDRGIAGSGGKSDALLSNYDRKNKGGKHALLEQAESWLREMLPPWIFQLLFGKADYRFPYDALNRPLFTWEENSGRLALAEVGAAQEQEAAQLHQGSKPQAMLRTRSGAEDGTRVTNSTGAEKNPSGAEAPLTSTAASTTQLLAEPSPSSSVITVVQYYWQRQQDRYFDFLPGSFSDWSSMLWSSLSSPTTSPNNAENRAAFELSQSEQLASHVVPQESREDEPSRARTSTTPRSDHSGRGTTSLLQTAEQQQAFGSDSDMDDWSSHASHELSADSSATISALDREGKSKPSGGDWRPNAFAGVSRDHKQLSESEPQPKYLPYQLDESPRRYHVTLLEKARPGQQIYNAYDMASH
ncbi:unnamed protein product [Amoebophrya sp. A120]|nr:unnamed protein product [Amoebophrya sp. A120]|eukprot:GSA120T00015228001.1